MKLKYDFVINNVAGETIAVSVGSTSGRFNGYIKLNETGAFIFKLLKNDISREELIDAVVNEFKDATLTQATETVDEFIEKLKEASLVI